MRPTILTVDDAKAVRTLVEKAVAPFDCEVTTATNGFEAFFAIERVRPDLILLDISMPVMGGVETLRRLKAAPELVGIPVIMLTSRADHTVVPLLPKMGAVGNVLKPFDETTLLAAIQKVLKLKPTSK
ncbi:MAG: response regulator [Lacunisphaera sp.]